MTDQPQTKWRSTLLMLTLAITLVAVSWSRAIDEKSLAYLTDTLGTSTAIYATARSINALVSVLQGTEVKAVFLSFTAGEVLDPVNDLIERFSALMLLALASLVVQYLLIEIAAHQHVSVMLTAFVCLTIALWLRPVVVTRLFLLRLLLVALLFRLALPAIAVTTQIVDSLFLASREQAKYEQMQGFQQSLKDTTPQLELTNDAGQTAPDLIQEADALALTLEEKRRALDDLGEQLERAQERLAQLPQPPVWQPWKNKSEEVQRARAAIDDLEQQRDKQQEAVNSDEKREDALREQAECLKQRSEGKSCSLLGKVTDWLPKGDTLPQIAAITSEVDDFVTGLVALLVSLLLRSVLLPIATLWLFVKLTMQGTRLVRLE